MTDEDIDKMPRIECRCGCGTLIPPFLRQSHKPRNFAKGHWVRTQKEDKWVYIRNSMKKYGLTEQEVRELLRISNCQICGQPAQAIDHDHSTGVARGRLCTRCNQGLGFFDDDIEKLSRAMSYLMKSTDVLSAVQAGELSNAVQ